MKIGVVTEARPGERRVALVPESVKRLTHKGAEIVVQAGAGTPAGFSDDEYRAQGAAIVDTREALLSAADTIVQINVPQAGALQSVKKGAASISLLFPLVQHDVVRGFRDASVTAIALDRIPRTTLAQSMDVLSSQATVAGYRAVITAANHLPKFFPLFMTAAGRVEPARVVILGAGVAGLVAIGVARRLGAVVEAYDVRPVVKEQVESLGATFIDVGATADAQTAGGYAKEVSEDFQKRANEVIATHLEKADVCITTALIPGRPAPRLVTAAMARRMRPGSVIVDLAAEQGGNCELTKPDTEVTDSGVLVLGPTNLPSEAARDASQMFSRNVEKYILYLLKDGQLNLDFSKEIVKGSVVTHDGQIVDTQVAEAIGA
ncbi:MAG TPA: Re/Si-specific NAD(P)(+) transhydrogenase subunit alpha [Candidatus Limnocylindrales bacterium]|nr:Re/Si-specific NAD(P)(+) transhydrogenase subunit alpha [Candidatus Limnocylindrales bacterium]